MTSVTTATDEADLARRRANFQRLLRPRHIAVFGGRPAAEVVRQCRRIGFTGEIWPVHPRHDEVHGLRCVRNVAELPEAPDASFIALPRETSVEVVAALAQRGAGGAVCYASGFAEVGAEGVLLQQQLVDAAEHMALVGPNCYGVLNGLDGAALWPDEHGGRRVERGVAIIAQSGNIGLNLTMQRRALPIAYLLTLGNQAGIGLAEAIEGRHRAAHRGPRRRRGLLARGAQGAAARRAAGGDEVRRLGRRGAHRAQPHQLAGRGRWPA